jgi:hypothetical protein
MIARASAQEDVGQKKGQLLNSAGTGQMKSRTQPRNHEQEMVLFIYVLV